MEECDYFVSFSRQSKGKDTPWQEGVGHMTLSFDSSMTAYNFSAFHKKITKVIEEVEEAPCSIVILNFIKLDKGDE